MNKPLRDILLLTTLGCSSAFSAISAIGTTGDLDRARQFKERVAVPGHDDAQAWSSSIDLGASATRGNSDTTFITASVTLDLDFDQYEFFGNFTYAYGENRDTVTEDEYILTASVSRLLNETGRPYFGIRLDGRHDDLADIDYRFGLNVFSGYYLIKTKEDTLQLSVEGGFGYAAESQGLEESTFATVYTGQRFNYWITDFTRIYQALAFFGQVADIEDFQIIAEAGLETFLSDSLSFKAFAQIKYESIPAINRESDDLRLVTGLSYKF